jgi:tetratricopeptide (TPR) repeat protein
LNAKTLFNQGVSAIRKKKNGEGRRLIKQSLKLYPQNDSGWVWLARTETDPERKRRCLRQALKLNADNLRAQAMLERLPAPPTSVNQDNGRAAKLTRADKEIIAVYLKKAEKLKRKKDLEGAADQWEEVLNFQSDHEVALQGAFEALDELGYMRAAEDLIWAAIEDGTDLPYAYFAAMRFTRHYDRGHYDDLREELLRLPRLKTKEVLLVANELVADKKLDEALRVLKRRLKKHSQNAELLIGLGDFYRDRKKVPEAILQYNKAVQIDRNKEAEKRLADYPPILNDQERGSLLLALREVIGIGFFYLLFAWQDVRLSLYNMDAAHWVGVILSLFAGYLLVSGTSSPQQQPLAGILGGRVPQYNTDAPIIQRGRGSALEEISQIPKLSVLVRVVCTVSGLLLLVMAFALVFSTSLDLLVNF